MKGFLFGKYSFIYQKTDGHSERIEHDIIKFGVTSLEKIL